MAKTDGVLIAALLLILFASQSRAGIVALIISFIVMLICMRKVFLKNWIASIAIIAVACIAFLVINAMNQDILLNRLKEMFDVPETTHALKSIETNDDNVTITYNDAQLSFYVTQNEDGNDVFTLVDGNNEQNIRKPPDILLPMNASPAAVDISGQNHYLC